MVRENPFHLRPRVALRVARRTLADLLIVFIAHGVASILVASEQAMSASVLDGLISAGLYILINATLGFYSRLWGYSEASEPLLILLSTGLGTVVLFLLIPLHSPLDSRVILLQGNLILIGFLIARYYHQLWRSLEVWWAHLQQDNPNISQSNVLIVGTTHEAEKLATRLRQDHLRRYRIVGFIDGNLAHAHMAIKRWPVLGAPDDIPRIAQAERVDLIIVAQHEHNTAESNHILDVCQQTTAQIKILPDGLDLLNNQRWNLNMLKDVGVEDLLGREQVAIDRERCQVIIQGKTVLITGASGSIGSELTRQVATFAPGKLLLLDNNESALHDLYVELQSHKTLPPTQIILGDITHAAKIKRIFEEEHPDLVLHAAAYKHVPLLEVFPEEAIFVNLLGTLILSEYAARYDVERFVFVSTDKAVNPTSIMGGSKRICEMWLSALNRITPQTIYTMVRFGNVIGSRGSVVPIFERQIEWGGPVTVTHPDMTRYFMSIPEAVSLMLHAITLGHEGHLYMLDMGKQISILALAQRMIRLRGLRVGADIQITYTGVRPGEKLHEELIYGNEKREKTNHPRIHQLIDQNHTPELKTVLGAILTLANAAQQPHWRKRLRSALLAAASGQWDTTFALLADIDRYQSPWLSPNVSLLAGPDVFHECTSSKWTTTQHVPVSAAAFSSLGGTLVKTG